jgi:hypothetical protein
MNTTIIFMNTKYYKCLGTELVLMGIPVTLGIALGPDLI